MFSVKPSIGRWRNANGMSITDSEAARTLYHEASAFMQAVAKHLQMDQCSCCHKWGRLESDLFVLHAGAKPMCSSPDCIGNRLHNDYGSADVISLATLGRLGKLSDRGWETAVAIEPLIGDVREYMDKIECYRGSENIDPRIRRHFRADFDEIDACCKQD